MGIGPEPAKMLLDLGLRPGFSVCELGNQMWHSGKRRDPKFWSRPARELYLKLGSGERYESIDANGGGTILADLNLPLDPHPGEFDLVTDFGTSEHIFDFAQVWRTIHSLTRQGGLIAFDKPFQGFPEHGFYKVDLTFFRDLAKANHYQIVRIDEIEAPRGRIWRGVMKRLDAGPFRNPQQGKWVPRLKI